MVLPDVAVEGCIEDANSSKVLTFDKNTGEVSFHDKVIINKIESQSKTAGAYVQN